MSVKILTVDDSKTIRLIVTKAFKPFDCSILEASNGLEGLSIANSQKPNLIILDLTMPVMDGFETLSKLKANPDTKSIPVVMLTAESGRDNVLRIAKQGVRDYLVKPFKEDLIVDRVRRILDLKPRPAPPPIPKRYIDPLRILVVDDKPAISDQIRSGLADTPWSIIPHNQSIAAFNACLQSPPDLLLVSLSLPNNDAFSLLQSLRSNPATASLPAFAMCVKTATDDQARAQTAGFSGLVSKPFEFEELKAKISRTLNLDTSCKYFLPQNGFLLLSLPASFNSNTAIDVSLHLRNKTTEAVDSGIQKLVLDLSAIRSPSLDVVKLGLEITNLCNELGLHLLIVGSPTVTNECRKYEETQEWPFVASIEEAIAAHH